MRRFLRFSWLLWGLMLLTACRGRSTSQPVVTLLPPNPQTNPLYQGIPPTVTPTPHVTPTFTATPTLPPTVTPTPVPKSGTAPKAATATLPASGATPPLGQERPGPVVLAFKLDHPIVLDASPDDWGNVPPYSIRHVTFGQAHYKGLHDASGVFLAGWDGGYLYFWVHVTDDVYVQEGHGANIFRGDSVEVLLDTRLEEDLYTHILSSDDMQFGFSAGNPPGSNPEVWQWYPRSMMGRPKGVQVVAVGVPDGYRLEIAIPWARLNQRPRAGLRMGFVISISDNDTPGTLRQETLVSNVPYRRLIDPTTWGELQLIGGTSSP
ncbi:MAG: hypothetical protein GXO36_03935 [Chloroflexi bacterium]|nr:hypothetical protein [Chloroflexota bacterium]